MIDREHLEISDWAVAQLRKLGVTKNTRELLHDMAFHSAPVTHSKGNRRFNDYVLLVEDNVVKSISKF